MSAREKASHIVLHVLMQRGAMLQAQFRGLIDDAFQQCGLPRLPGNTDAVIEEVKQELNRSLNFAAMEVRKATAEESGDIYWGLVNLRPDQIGSIATKFTFVELTAFKSIIDLIVRAPPEQGEERRKPPKLRGTTHINRVLKLGKAQEMGPLLDRFVNDMWLWRRGNRIGLGVRTIMELHEFLTATYGERNEASDRGEAEPDLMNCSVCLDPVFFGEPCPQCNSKLHRHCLRTFANGRARAPCPLCHVEWPVPDNAVDNDDV